MKGKSRIVPAVFYLLTGLTAVTGTMSMYVWYRELISHFGNHAVSVSSITAALLCCLAFGSLVAGKRADQTDRRLVLFGLFALTAGLYACCHPLLVRLMNALFNIPNPALHPAPFGFALLRILFSLLFLFIPAGTTAAAFPLLVRHFIRYPIQSENYMSALAVSLSAGASAGLLLLLILIPGNGMQNAQFVVAVLLILTATLTLLFRTRLTGKTPGGQTTPVNAGKTKTTIRFRKKRAMPETAIKLKQATWRVFAIQGFTTAAMLLISYRILGYYSMLKPVYLYSLAMVLLMSGLALGSSLYRRTTGKPLNSFLTLATLQIFTGLTAILAYVALYLAHRVIMQGAGGSASFSAVLFYHALLYATLVLIPAVCLGLSLPLTGKLYADRLQHIGNSFGRLGFLWPLSVLAGIILTQFILIPLTGLYYAYFTVVLLVILSGTYLILRDSRLIRGFRLGYALLSVVVYFIIVGAFKSVVFNFPAPDNPGNISPVTKIEGSTTSLSSFENASGSKVVLLNNQYCFSTDPAGMLVQQLPAYLSLLLNNNIQSALVIGFGTGIASSILETGGVTSIHIAEIHPEIIRFSANVLADVNDDILTSSKVTITIEDGRSYLHRAAVKTDLIFAGCTQPMWLTHHYTREFYRLCHDRLSDKGMICQVLPADILRVSEFRSLFVACAGVFPDVSIWYISPDHVLMVAGKSVMNTTFCRLYSGFPLLNRNGGLTALDIPDAASLAGRLLADNSMLRNYAGHEEANLDNKPGIRYGHMLRAHAPEELRQFLVKFQLDYPGFLAHQDTCSRDLYGEIIRIQQINAALKQLLTPAPGVP